MNGHTIHLTEQDVMLASTYAEEEVSPNATDRILAVAKLRRHRLGKVATRMFFEQAGILSQYGPYVEDWFCQSKLNAKTPRPVRVDVLANDDPKRAKVLGRAADVGYESKVDIWIVATIHAPQWIVLDGWLGRKDWDKAADWKNGVLALDKSTVRPILSLFDVLCTYCPWAEGNRRNNAEPDVADGNHSPLLAIEPGNCKPSQPATKYDPSEVPFGL